MAKSEVQRQVDIKLWLTPDEAYWLKALCQNPIDVRFPQDELESDKLKRESLFEALPPFEELT